jgi:ferric iron reductase protein FhuF
MTYFPSCKPIQEYYYYLKKKKKKKKKRKEEKNSGLLSDHVIFIKVHLYSIGSMYSFSLWNKIFF